MPPYVSNAPRMTSSCGKPKQHQHQQSATVTATSNFANSDYTHCHRTCRPKRHHWQQIPNPNPNPKRTRRRPCGAQHYHNIRTWLRQTHPALEPNVTETIRGAQRRTRARWPEAECARMSDARTFSSADLDPAPFLVAPLRKRQPDVQMQERPRGVEREAPA